MASERQPIEIKDQKCQLAIATQNVEQFADFLKSGNAPEYLVNAEDPILRSNQRRLFADRLRSVAKRQGIELSEVRGVLSKRMELVTSPALERVKTQVKERAQVQQNALKAYQEVEELYKAGLFSEAELQKAREDYNKALRLVPSAETKTVTKPKEETPVHPSRLAVIQHAIDNPDVSKEEIVDMLGTSRQGHKLSSSQAIYAMVGAFNKLKRHSERSRKGRLELTSDEAVTNAKLLEYVTKNSLINEWPMVILILGKLDPRVLGSSQNRQVLSSLLKFVPHHQVSQLFRHFPEAEQDVKKDKFALVDNEFWVNENKVRLTPREQKAAELLLQKEGRLVSTLEVQKALSDSKSSPSSTIRPLKSKVDKAAGREVLAMEGIKTGTKYGLFASQQVLEQAVANERERIAQEKQAGLDRHIRALTLIHLWVESPGALEQKQVLRTLGLKETGKYISGAANQITSGFLDLTQRDVGQLSEYELEVRGNLESFAQKLRLSSEKEVLISIFQALDPALKSSVEQALKGKGRVKYINPKLADKLMKYLGESASQGSTLEPEPAPSFSGSLEIAPSKAELPRGDQQSLSLYEEALRQFQTEQQGRGGSKSSEMEKRDPKVHRNLNMVFSLLDRHHIDNPIRVSTLTKFFPSLKANFVDQIEEKRYITPDRGRDHHPILTREEIALLWYLREFGNNLSPRQVKELNDIIAQDLKRWDEKKKKKDGNNSQSTGGRYIQ